MRRTWVLVVIGAVVLLVAYVAVRTSLGRLDGVSGSLSTESQMLKRSARELAAGRSLGVRDSDEVPTASAASADMSPVSATTPAATPPTLTTAQLASSQAPGPDRLLVRNATLSIEVANARTAATRLATLAVAQRGYVGNLTEAVDALGVRTVSVQVRVPYDRFDQTTSDIRSLGKLLDMKVTAEDVTEEFTDAQARVRNLKSTELRLLDHLASSHRLQDTLAVEREVTRVRGEIEEIEGRLRFLAHRIAYCTFDVTLSETPKQQALVPPETFSTGHVAGDASRSMVSFVLSVWEVVIWVAVWAAVWLPVGLVAVWAIRRNGRRTTPSNA